MPIECRFYNEFSAKTGRHFLRDLAKHKRAIQSKERFLKSVKKCDKAPMLPEGSFKGDLFRIALEYTDRMYAFCYGVEPTAELEFNRATSPGHPYNKKYRTKGEFLDVPGLLAAEMEKRETMLFKVNSKDEFLPAESVDVDEKLRTFFSPPITGLARQKVFTTEPNKRLLDYASKPENWDRCWARYGFTKQFGGFDRLMAFHAEKRFTSMSDASGYDRVLPLMRHVWNLREKWFRFESRGGKRIERSPAFWEDFYQVRDEVCQPYCFLPDGTIVRRLCGNVSGSDTTTTDNTIAHTIIKFYHYLLAGYYFTGEVFSYETILAEFYTSLYGDDELNSHDGPDVFGEGFTEELYRDFTFEAYADFGMTIKSSAYAQAVDTVVGMAFLGSECLSDGLLYYPKPNLSKLASSATMCVHGRQKDPVQLFSVIRALWELTKGIPDPDCEKAADELEAMASFYLRQDFEHSLPYSCLEMLEEVAAGNLQVVNNLRFGHESNGTLGWFGLLKNVDKTTVLLETSY